MLTLNSLVGLGFVLGAVVFETVEIVKKIKEKKFEEKFHKDFINKTGIYSYLAKNK